MDIMSGIERVGVSLDKELLAEFDALIADKGYGNRSEAVRDLIRAKLTETALESPDAEGIGSVFLIYDHHVSKLAEQLIQLQHSHLLKVITSIHVHLDHHNCLEVIIIKGRVREIQKLADKMASLKGVKHGRLTLTAAGNDHDHPKHKNT
jgi:CopG family transcriptional regulator, nickel-responsive regulator